MRCESPERDSGETGQIDVADPWDASADAPGLSAATLSAAGAGRERALRGQTQAHDASTWPLPGHAMSPSAAARIGLLYLLYLSPLGVLLTA